MKSRVTIRARICFCVIGLCAIAFLPTVLQAADDDEQWAGRDGWIEEPATKSLNGDGGMGHAYLDPASVHRGEDGLVYFNESSDVTRPEQIGKVGLMKDAYDCAKDVKYMCVGRGDWRNDKRSTLDASREPALPIYRRYLCGDAASSDSSSSNSRAQ
jgi:hypothetical protein